MERKTRKKPKIESPEAQISRFLYELTEQLDYWRNENPSREISQALMTLIYSFSLKETQRMMIEETKERRYENQTTEQGEEV